MVFSLPSAKKPSERVSGDQKGKIAFSLPATARASSASMGRIQIAVLPSVLVAVNATVEPSGESTGGPAESPVRLSWVFSGGLITVRVTCAEGAEWLRKVPAITPSARAMTKAAAQAKRSFFRGVFAGNAGAALEELLLATHCNSSLTSCAV
jgi:hypothetical protein